MLVLGKTEVTEVNGEPEVVMGTVFEDHESSFSKTEVEVYLERRKVAESNPAGLFVWSLCSGTLEWISSITAVYCTSLCVYQY